jgi:hypothetical protein
MDFVEFVFLEEILEMFGNYYFVRELSRSFKNIFRFGDFNLEGEM